MSSARYRALLLAATALAIACATAADLSSFHGRLAAEWAWTSAASDDESCWGSPTECPVVYDLDADDGGEAAGAGQQRRRRRLQYYYEVNTAAPTAQFISYSALARDSVPCSLAGASYYNCQPGADANPYVRGCSAITQCRE